MTHATPVVAVVSGTGLHRDPWHGLDATADAIASILEGPFEVRRTTTDDLAPLDGSDLVVLNVGGDLVTPEGDSRAIVDRIVALHEQGVPLLAVHSSALAFRDDARWAQLLGGRWVPGVTMHPQIGAALVEPARGSPYGDGEPFVLYDERYTALERHEGTLLVASHTEDGISHPLVWARAAAAGRGAVVYDALGHGVEAYASTERRRLLLDAVGWLLGERMPADARAASSGVSATASLRRTRGDWNGVVVDAAGFELVTLAAPAAAPAPTGFVDAFLSDTPRTIVAGYVRLEADTSGERIALVSHGHEVASLARLDDGVAIELPQAAQPSGRVLRAPEAGLAFVAEQGEWGTDAHGRPTLTGTAWRLTIVHGPAPEKVENRIRLLDTVRRVAREGSDPRA